MSNQSTFYTNLTQVKCPICDASFDFSPKDDNPNSYCFHCTKCHMCFCASCGSFPFHYNRKCNSSEILKIKSNSNHEHYQSLQISDHLCEKVKLDDITFSDNSFSHPFLNQDFIDELHSISLNFCKANLIPLNRQDINNDLKKKIFDRMNVYLCKNHRKPVIFIFGHKNECEIENSEACPICHCDQIPICPEHKFTHMSYKCCNCSSTATHVEFIDRKFRFLCEICHQTCGMSEAIRPSEQGERKGRFYPYSNMNSKIVGRCNICECLFVL